VVTGTQGRGGKGKRGPGSLKFSALPHWARFRCSSKWNNGFKQNCVPENKQTGE